MFQKQQDINRNKFECFINRSHISLKESKALLKEYGIKSETVPSFVFVRNPWDFYVSRFFFRRQSIEKGDVKKFIPLERCETSIKGFRKHMSMVKEVIDSGNMSHKNLVGDGSTGLGRMYMHHTISDWHVNLGGNDVEFTGKFENLFEDLHRILTLTCPGIFYKKDIKKKSQRDKTNSSIRPPYKKCYTKDIVKWVEAWDEDYCQRFNYNF